MLATREFALNAHSPDRPSGADVRRSLTKVVAALRIDRTRH